MTKRSPEKRRVLLISYHFPPLTRGGVFRALKFAKYLPEYGWDPVVLCAAPTADDAKDPMLLDELSESVVVQRVGHLHPRQIERCLRQVWTLLWKLRLRALAELMQPYKLLRWIPPDPYITWNRPTFRAAIDLIQEYEPSVILTTSPPHSTQLIGRRLKHITQMPWVADFRDPWTSNTNFVYTSRFHRQLSLHWERKVLDEADIVIANTETQASQWRLLSDQVKKESIVTINNGFDPADFANWDISAGQATHFRIVYTGTLYARRQAKGFLVALDHLVTSEAIPGSRLRVEFVGTIDAETLNTYADRAWFSYQPQQPHEYALHLMEQASVLLDVVADDETYTLTTKLFEYLRASRPILALAPSDSETAKVIRSSQAGIVVPPDDAGAITAAIMTFFRAWQAGTLEVDTDWTVIESFDRRKLTGQLAHVLDGLVHS